MKSYGNQPKAMNDYEKTILEIQDGLLVHGLIETDVGKCVFPNYVSFNGTEPPTPHSPIVFTMGKSGKNKIWS